MKDLSWPLQGWRSAKENPLNIQLYWKSPLPIKCKKKKRSSFSLLRQMWTADMVQKLNFDDLDISLVMWIIILITILIFTEKHYLNQGDVTFAGATTCVCVFIPEEQNLKPLGSLEQHTASLHLAIIQFWLLCSFSTNLQLAHTNTTVSIWQFLSIFQHFQSWKDKIYQAMLMIVLRCYANK